LAKIIIFTYVPLCAITLIALSLVCAIQGEKVDIYARKYILILSMKYLAGGHPYMVVFTYIQNIFAEMLYVVRHRGRFLVSFRHISAIFLSKMRGGNYEGIEKEPQENAGY